MRPDALDRFAASHRDDPRAGAAADVRVRRPHGRPRRAGARRAARHASRRCRRSSGSATRSGSRSSRAAPAPGLSGGALPVAEGIVISLARLTRILEIDIERGQVVVEPGVANLDVTRAVGVGGLLLRARPVVAAGLHDRRQRRRELGRRALPQVRLHGQPRPRGGDRAAGRRARRAVRLGRRPRPARRLRRLGGDARHRDEADAADPAVARGGA